MHRKTIRELTQMLANREISSLELTSHFISRIEKYDNQLNSLISFTKEAALEQAKEADQSIAKGNISCLTGIPFIHKDVFCTKDIRTTCGSKMLENFVSPYNATVTEKFYQNHAPILGKANMDEFAMGSSNENSYFGPSKNPWDLERVPGGSSGGSAAAVAAGLTPFATGTDTGGSIRQPASLCGITGLKPTYGLVSRYGMIAYASSMDQGGPMAKTAEDCAYILNVMSGFDEKDSTSVNQPVCDYTTNLEQSLKGLTIGIPKEFFAEGIDPNVATQIMQALKVYENLGAKCVDISLPIIDVAIPTYYIIAPAECSSNLARFDGIRYGYRHQDAKNLEEVYKKSRSEGFGPEVKRRIMLGTYVLSSGYFDAYYIEAQKVRRLIANHFTEAFKTVDVIMGPTSPTTAFKIGEKTDNPLNMYLSDIYTISVNLAGLPAISIPAGFVDGLPIGLQIIANHFAESKLLNVAHMYQRETNWHLNYPKNFD